MYICIQLGIVKVKHQINMRSLCRKVIRKVAKKFHKIGDTLDRLSRDRDDVGESVNCTHGDEFEAMRDSLVNLSLIHKEASPIQGDTDTLSRMEDDDKTLAMLRICDIDAVLFDRFMALPRELWDMVFATKFLTFPDSITMRSTSVPDDVYNFPPIVPAFCWISRQVFCETVPLLFRGKNITLKDNTSEAVTLFTEFVDQVPGGGGFNYIETLKIEECSLCGFGGSIQDLLSRCTSLRHLTLEIPASILTVFSDFWGEYATSHALRTKEDILKNYFPLAIFECRKLETLRLIFTAGEVYGKLIGCADEHVFNNFHDCVKEEIEKCGAKCWLEVVYVPAEKTSSNCLPDCWGWEAAHEEGAEWSTGYLTADVEQGKKVKNVRLRMMWEKMKSWGRKVDWVDVIGMDRGVWRMWY